MILHTFLSAQEKKLPKMVMIAVDRDINIFITFASCYNQMPWYPSPIS